MPSNKLTYNSYGQKYQVPRVRVSSLNELQNGGHCALHRYSGAYWHHFIVEYIDHEAGEIHAIEYSNTAKGFCTDNCIPPLKEFTIAKVVRTIYKFQDEVVYLLMHDNCLDPDDVVSKAQEKVGEGKYYLFSNHCEHFAMWCKTGTSSSDQINKAKEMLTNPTKGPLTSVGAMGGVLANQTVTKGGRGLEDGDSSGLKGSCDPNCTNKAKEMLKKPSPLETMGAIGAALANQTVTKGGQEVVKTTVRMASREVFTQTVLKAGQEVAKTTVRSASKQVLAHTVSKAGQEVVKTGIRVASKEAVVQTVSKVGQEVVKTGIRVASKEAVAQTVSKVGQEVVKTGIRVASKETVIQTASKVGQEVVKTGIHQATKETVAQTVSNAAQQVVSKGIHQATKEVLTQTGSNSGQTIIKTVARKTTEEVLIRTGSEAGQEIVKTGVREVSEEVVTQTVSQPATGLGSSLTAGAVCAAVFEGIQITRDILSAHSDMKAGKNDINEFKTAAGKRVIYRRLNRRNGHRTSSYSCSVRGRCSRSFCWWIRRKIFWKHYGKFSAVKTGRPRTFLCRQETCTVAISVQKKIK